ncbi:MAG: chemotaxis protein CheW [Thiobacillaceae bacterium]
MTMDMSQFYQVFFEEAAEHLANMEALLLAIDVEAPSVEDLNAIFRAAHSIKGGSGTFGFSDMTEVTHILETLLDRVRKGELELVPEMVDACLAAGDVLKAQLAHHQGGPAADAEAVREVCARLESLSVAMATNADSDTLYWVECALSPEITADAANVDNLLAALAEVASCDVKQRPSAESPRLALWASTNQGEAALREILSFYAFPEDILIQPGGPRAAYGLFVEGESAPTRVSEPAYGLFDEATGGHTPALSHESESGYGFFKDVPGTPAGETAQANDMEGGGFGFFAGAPGTPATASASVVPVAPVVATAHNHGRRASDDPLLASVRTGRRETDKLAISATAEASSIRVAVEKVDQLINLVGELVITQAMLAQSASQLDPVQDERLLAGINLLARNTRDLQEAVMGIRMLPMSMVFSRFPRVVRDVASKLGKQVELRTIGEATELDKGLIEKITDPLTHLVRNSLDHGIETPERRIAAGKPPKGTLTLKAAHQGGSIVIEVMDDGAGLDRNKILAKARERGLPVHDAMSDQEVWQLIYAPGFSTADQVTDVSGRGVGMDVVKKNIEGLGGKVEIESSPGFGTRTIISLPLTLAILDGMSVGVGGETYIVPLTQVVESLQPRAEDIKTIAGEGRVVSIRGEYLPLIPLAEVFDLRSSVREPSRGILMVVEAEGSRAALFVDELLGQHQVVIKNLESNYRKVEGISGATIMGDGRVALILDIAAVTRMGHAINRNAYGRQAA